MQVDLIKIKRTINLWYDTGEFIGKPVTGIDVYGYTPLHAHTPNGNTYGVVLIDLPKNEGKSLINAYEEVASAIHATRLKEACPTEIVWFMYVPEMDPDVLDKVHLRVLCTAEDGSVIYDVAAWENVPNDSLSYKKIMEIINTLTIPRWRDLNVQDNQQEPVQ
jgi:hypothetical protein